jgi:hypothetical protein
MDICFWECVRGMWQRAFANADADAAAVADVDVE